MPHDCITESFSDLLQSAYLWINMNLLPAEYSKAIQDYFQTQPVVRAWAFGSWSRGMATEHSDIDLLVELDYSKPVGLEFIQMHLDLQA